MMFANIQRLQLGGAISLLAVTAACGDTGSAAPGAPDGGSSSTVGAGGAALAAETVGASSGMAGDKVTVLPGERCSTDYECDDGSFCNGREVCAELPDSDYRVCQVPELGPCPAENCDEGRKQCDCSAGHADADGDGFKAAGCVSGDDRPDCDDDDSNRYPTNQEECDLDDPTHDEDCDPSTFFGHDGDDDHDDYVNDACANFRGYQPSRKLEERRLKQGAGSDCNDDEETGADVHPGAEEVCDGFDNNCNDVPDEVSGAPLSQSEAYYRDLDGDSFGSENEADILYSLCNLPPPGYVTNSGDCDDTNAHVAPSRAEVCNGIDDDCDEIVDQPLEPGTLMFDEPFDGVTTFACVPKEPDSAEWVVADCPEGRLDCDHRSLNACEVPDTTLCNCHGCDTGCSFSCGASGCEEIKGGSAGVGHTCFLVTSAFSASGSVACAGLNLSAQLGNGATKDSAVAIQVPGLQGVVGVAAGSDHSCALADDGRIYCWGGNEFGQLGAGLVEASHREPVAVLDLGLPAKQIVSGPYHVCALYEQVPGSTFVGCWGRGDSGQLGSIHVPDGFYASVPDWVYATSEDGDVALEGASQLVAGYEHTCALVRGQVFCWGTNYAWQLGVDPSSRPISAVAVRVPGLDDVDEIVAAANHSCARVGGDVYCWGLNHAHQLATEGNSAGPTHIALPADIESMAAGADFTCVLGTSGAVTCWGSSAYGERGTMSAPIAPSPLPIERATRVVGGQGNHICALLSDGRTLCLGRNDVGQLADGAASTGPQPTPTPILPMSGSKKCGDHW